MCFLQEQNADTTSKPQFVASKQWQDIQDGQKVPSGLHYRMNLATGKKEAKLLEDESIGQGKISSCKNSPYFNFHKCN